MDLPPLSPGAHYYDPKEVADWLRVSRQCVANWLRAGTLQGHKFGDLWRVSPDALAAFVAEAQKKGQER